jgi:hypothetical protein
MFIIFSLSITMGLPHPNYALSKAISEFSGSLTIAIHRFSIDLFRSITSIKNDLGILGMIVWRLW